MVAYTNKRRTREVARNKLGSEPAGLNSRGVPIFKIMARKGANVSGSGTVAREFRERTFSRHVFHQNGTPYAEPQPEHIRKWFYSETRRRPLPVGLWPWFKNAFHVDVEGEDKEDYEALKQANLDFTLPPGYSTTGLPPGFYFEPDERPARLRRDREEADDELDEND